MQVKDECFGSWALYLSFGTFYEVNIRQLCSSSVYKDNTPERFCTMYEKCKFLSMGYISAFDKSQCVNMKQRMFVCDLKLQQKTLKYILYSQV